MILASTEASDIVWAEILTQVNRDDMGKKAEQQKDQPLAFIRGWFNKNLGGWTTYKKEELDIIKVFERMDYVLWRPISVKIYSEHSKCLSVFAPVVLCPNAPDMCWLRYISV